MRRRGTTVRGRGHCPHVRVVSEGVATVSLAGNFPSQLDERKTSMCKQDHTDSLTIDCDSCAVRGPACHDCVVSVLLGAPPELAFDAEERRALDVLAGSGLVPPLRLVSQVDERHVESA